MYRRALQLAGFFLLLAAIGAPAETSAQRSPTLVAPYVRILIQQQRAAEAASRSSLPETRVRRNSVLELAPAERSQKNAVWNLNTPLAGALGIQAFTRAGL